MRLRLVLSLALLTAASPAFAENWQPVPGENGTYYDADFMKVDATSGLVVMREATGKPHGASYKDWGAGKSPILVYALDCTGDSFIDLGIDMTGSTPLPKDWRDGQKQDDIDLGVGHAGKIACEKKASLPALP
ncbi:MAG: hypothetical protein ACM3YN_01700 [Parcubacteria group bacterium]